MYSVYAWRMHDVHVRERVRVCVCMHGECVHVCARVYMCVRVRAGAEREWETNPWSSAWVKTALCVCGTHSLGSELWGCRPEGGALGPRLCGAGREPSGDPPVSAVAPARSRVRGELAEPGAGLPPTVGPLLKFAKLLQISP